MLKQASRSNNDSYKIQKILSNIVKLMNSNTNYKTNEILIRVGNIFINYVVKN